MRRDFIVYVAIVLSMVLIAGLAVAEKCHKAEAAKEQKCTQLKVCTKAEGAESAQGAEKCGNMQECKGTGGCHSMMSKMPMGQMMMQRTMGCGKRAGMRGKGRAKGGELHRLGGPALFAHGEKKLDLTEKQVEDLKALKWDFQKSAIEKKAQIEIARVELNELMDQTSVDFGKIKTQISQIADLEKEIRLAHLANIERSHKLLTAEQLEKAKTLKMGRGHGVGGCTKEIIKEIIIEEAPE